MAHYLVKLRDSGGQVVVNNARGALVDAESAALARGACAAAFPGTSGWADSHVFLLDTLSAEDLTGYRFELRVSPGIFVTFTSTMGLTLDDVGVILAGDLLDHGLLGASYEGATGVLTIAGAQDAAGDRTVDIRVFPPESDVPDPQFVTDVIHQGAQATLEATLVMPALGDRVLAAL